MESSQVLILELAFVMGEIRTAGDVSRRSTTSLGQTSASRTVARPTSLSVGAPRKSARSWTMARTRRDVIPLVTPPTAVGSGVTKAITRPRPTMPNL